MDDNLRMTPNVKPNRASCTNWLNCGRRYELIEYDDTTSRMEGTLTKSDTSYFG